MNNYLKRPLFDFTCIAKVACTYQLHVYHRKEQNKTIKNFRESWRIWMLGSKRAPRIFIGQGRFSEARAQFLFIFQINSDKIRADVVILEIRGLSLQYFQRHHLGWYR